MFLTKANMFACSWADQPSFLGLNFKTSLALAQTFGYAAGKVPSLIYSPKLPHSRLRGALIAVVAAAGSCIALSCFTPAAASLILVWLACVCLAPTWSILQRFLEGRRVRSVWLPKTCQRFLWLRTTSCTCLSLIMSI